jgi:multimeric flavodoxin WrbA
MNKNVVLIMGSHRSNANTAYWIDAMSSKMAEMDVTCRSVDVNKLLIKPCIDCNYCKNNWGKCVHVDDMAQVYQMLKQADILIIATPVYFNGVTSKLKTLVDRCQMIFLCDFAHNIPFVDSVDSSGKQGYIVSVGGAGHYPNQFIGTEITLKLIFNNLRMPLTEHIKYSETDQIALKDRTEVEADILRLSKAIYNEVMGIEG